MIAFTTGTMFAGKTKALIEQAKAQEGSVVIKATTNKVEGDKETGLLRSRNKTEIECYIYDVSKCSLAELVENLAKEHKTEYIYIDESQFLSRFDLEELVELQSKKRMLINLFGLESDFRNRLFSTTRYIYEVSDIVFKEECLCARACGEYATINHRLSDEDDVLSENATYEPICQGCYNAEV